MREEVLFENKRQIEGPGVLYEGNYYSGHAWHGKASSQSFTSQTKEEKGGAALLQTFRR